MCGITDEAFAVMEACTSTDEGAAACAIASVPPLEIDLYLPVGLTAASGSGR